MTDDCIVEARGIGAVFGPTTILHDVDLCVRRGEVMALIGGSGSGKTTLLRLTLGLERPMAGTIRVFGEELRDAAAGTRAQVQTRCGVVFQSGALFSALNVFENVALPLRELKTLPDDLIRRLVLYKLGQVEIDAASAAKMPAELSGGMVKRVALARAIALDPELLFLDEPTAGLDPDRAKDFVRLIESLRRALHLTVLMATHDVETVIGLADRVAVLAEQRLVAVDSLWDVVEHPHPFVQSFFLGREHPDQAALHDYRARLEKTRHLAAER